VPTAAPPTTLSNYKVRNRRACEQHRHHPCTQPRRHLTNSGMAAFHSTASTSARAVLRVAGWCIRPAHAAEASSRQIPAASRASTPPPPPPEQRGQYGDYPPRDRRRQPKVQTRASNVPAISRRAADPERQWMLRRARRRDTYPVPAEPSTARKTVREVQGGAHTSARPRPHRGKRPPAPL